MSEKWLDLDYIWQVEPTGYIDGLYVGYEKKSEVKD